LYTAINIDYTTSKVPIDGKEGFVHGNKH